MFTNLLSIFTPSSTTSSSHSRTGYTKHAPTPRYRPSSAEDHFALLASLQIAVLAPPSTTTAPHGHNPANLRKQGRLALTFALKNHTAGGHEEKKRVADALEEAIDAAWSGVEDYRGRVYRVGGWLTENDGIVQKVIGGEVTVEEIAAGAGPAAAAVCVEKVVRVVPAYC